MEATKCHGHDTILVLLCLIMLPGFIIPAKAQPGSGQASDNNSYSYFSPAVAIIIAVIMTSLFFMVFFSIYIRQCSGHSSVATFPARTMAAMVRGLDRSIIHTFPTFTYSEVKEHKIVNGVLECAICLNEFEDNDTLRLIPKCDHVFHPTCIDAWLVSHVTCPVCRANLVPQSGDEQVHKHDLTNRDNLENCDNIGERSNSGDAEIVIQMEDGNQCQERLFKGDSSSAQRNVLTRSLSLRPKMFGLGKFRSHSTGHSLVQREQNFERFTLRLSSEIRTVMINRASLNQVTGQATMLPRVASSRKGYRPETKGEGSSRTGRSDREIRSDRWAFLTRALSMRSPRVRIEMDKSFSSDFKQDGIKTPAKLSSFKCTIEKTRSFPDETDRV